MRVASVINNNKNKIYAMKIFVKKSPPFCRWIGPNSQQII